MVDGSACWRAMCYVETNMKDSEVWCFEWWNQIEKHLNPMQISKVKKQNKPSNCSRKLILKEPFALMAFLSLLLIPRWQRLRWMPMLRQDSWILWGKKWNFHRLMVQLQSFRIQLKDSKLILYGHPLSLQKAHAKPHIIKARLRSEKNIS